jgi:hypothetical protein
MELDASTAYGFGTTPVSGLRSATALPSLNTSEIPGTGFGAHLNHPLFWLLVLGLIVLGIIGFSVSGKVRGVGHAGVTLR